MRLGGGGGNRGTNRARLRVLVSLKGQFRSVGPVRPLQDARHPGPCPRPVRRILNGWDDSCPHTPNAPWWASGALPPGNCRQVCVWGGAGRGELGAECNRLRPRRRSVRHGLRRDSARTERHAAPGSGRLACRSGSKPLKSSGQGSEARLLLQKGHWLPARCTSGALRSKVEAWDCVCGKVNHKSNFRDVVVWIFYFSFSFSLFQKQFI